MWVICSFFFFFKRIRVEHEVLLGKTLANNLSAAIVLGNKTIKDALTTLARPVFFSTAPSFPFVALIRSGYNLLKSGETRAVSHEGLSKATSLTHS